MGVQRLKGKIKLISVFIVCLIITVFPVVTHAMRGDCGYEGGISSGEAPNKSSFEYQEVCFITGEPIVFKGTLKIKKTYKNNIINTTYIYNLDNAEKKATLTRTLNYRTEITEKDNGQITEKTYFQKDPYEVIKIDNVTYTLKNYDFTRSSFIDQKPSINFYSGDIWNKKTYQTGGVNSGRSTVTVEATGNFYGYDQYWGSAETQIINYVISSESVKNGKIDKWTGTAKVTLSLTTTKQLKYEENLPEQSSYKGVYMEKQYNESILEYSCKLPEFDSKGVSTDIIKTKSGSLKIETFPQSQPLSVPDISHLRGHWAENDIRILYSLEIFKGDSSIFNPEQYISRAEFVSAIVEAAKEVPKDPAFEKKNTRTAAARKKKEEEVISPFIDVSTKSEYFASINAAYDRGIVSGDGGRFRPNEPITLADALVILVRSVGLEGMAPGKYPVTTFRDNDLIPYYARQAAFVAQEIGLVKGDTRGYLNPNEKLTKARAAALINNFINYMREGIKKVYTEGIVNYN
ncbi:MAG TPA: S-layer homology domain-containing protein [Clostridiaceae bacterium]|nr:S-layer homology domain-containing protein [Clostridiaceae bacterium]